VKFQVSLLSRVVGWVVGWVGEIEMKTNSAQLELELGLSLAISKQTIQSFDQQETNLNFMFKFQNLKIMPCLMYIFIFLKNMAK
jgi:hypothetical protein